MELARKSSVDTSMIDKLKRSLSFSSKGKEVIERTEYLIDEEDANKLLEKGFKNIRKQNLYREGFVDKFKSSIYVYTDESKLAVVNNKQTINLISKQAYEDLKTRNFSDIHMGVIVKGILGQVREGLDVKAHLYLYDSRFYDHSQAQIASAKIDIRNKVAVVGCIPNIDIDLNEFCNHIKLNEQTKGFMMNGEYKNIRIKI